MPYPTFTKTGMTTLTFSRGDVFPRQHIYQPRQRIGRSYAGTYQVATLGDPDERLPLVFVRLPQADYTALVAWFQHALINWAANSFTYTNSASVITVVRYLAGSLDMPEVSNGLYSVTLDLTKELS